MAKTTVKNPTSPIWEKSNLSKIGDKEGMEIPCEKSGIRLAKPASGCGTYTPANWQISPSPHVIRIPSRILPLTPFAISTAITNTPTRAKIAEIPAVENVPSAKLVWKLSILTSVAGLLTTTPAPFRPIRAIKRPMPAVMASLRLDGIALITMSRSFVSDKSKKTAPSTNTAAKAVCQLYPIPNTTVYAKYALRPRPGARIKG